LERSERICATIHALKIHPGKKEYARKIIGNIVKNPILLNTNGSTNKYSGQAAAQIIFPL